MEKSRRIRNILPFFLLFEIYARRRIESAISRDISSRDPRLRCVRGQLAWKRERENRAGGEGSGFRGISRARWAFLCFVVSPLEPDITLKTRLHLEKVITLDQSFPPFHISERWPLIFVLSLPLSLSSTRAISRIISCRRRQLLETCFNFSSIHCEWIIIRRL